MTPLCQKCVIQTGGFIISLPSRVPVSHVPEDCRTPSGGLGDKDGPGLEDEKVRRTTKYVVATPNPHLRVFQSKICRANGRDGVWVWVERGLGRLSYNIPSPIMPLFASFVFGCIVCV